MAYISLDTKKLRKNKEYLDKLLHVNNIEWAVVTKLLCGHKEFISEVLALGIKQVCDSRLSNLKTIKLLSNDVETIYIKPPPKSLISSIVKYADISFNTEINTIMMLSEESVRQNKKHKIIIMIEMGELREGVLREDLMEFYSTVFKLPGIEIIGLGTNLACMYGVLPNHDKLIQLCLYEQLIEAKFNREIRYVSGGSSVTIPLIFHERLPKGINHFRIGETLFLGTDVYNNSVLKDMEKNVFQLYSEIIELSEKHTTPDGQLGQNVSGEKPEFEQNTNAKTSFRAVIDLGLLDVDEKHVHLKNPDYKIVGASSDMLVIDLGINKENLKVGDILELEMDYIGTLRVMNSRYISKRVKK